LSPEVRKAMKNKTHKKEMTGHDFDALSDAEKEKIFAELDAEPVEQQLARSKPLNARERAFYERFRKAQRAKRKAGRPRIGKGAKVIAVSVERGLLKRADAYARRHGLKRTELIAQALRTVMGEKGEPRNAA
jgi:hypothetical protein